MCTKITKSHYHKLQCVNSACCGTNTMFSPQEIYLNICCTCTERGMDIPYTHSDRSPPKLPSELITKLNGMNERLVQ